MSIELIKGQFVPVWHKNGLGQPCWFPEGIPAINGICCWCGTPTEGHKRNELDNRQKSPILKFPHP